MVLPEHNRRETNLYQDGGGNAEAFLAGLQIRLYRQIITATQEFRILA